MNFSKRKKCIATILSVLIVALTITVLIGCLFNFDNPSKDADAAILSSSNSDILSTDLLMTNYTSRSDGKIFNGDVLSNIYKRITTNKTNATILDVETAAKDSVGKNTNTTMHSG